MRLATYENGLPDGELIVVSGDGERSMSAGPKWPSLLTAIESWSDALPDLRSLADRLEAGDGEAVVSEKLRAPLPRSWQWLDGSAFVTHGELMQVAFGMDPIDRARPLMYQGMSDRFLGPVEPAAFPSEADGIDFEGEFGVIVDFVPMGTSVEQAAGYIRLVVQINDWSLRTIAPVEMKTGFGWVQAKPACSMAPFAVTPDYLGEHWQNGRVCLDLLVERGGARFGFVNGGEMAFSFAELVAHAARTRDLVAGTVIGSGTVSNAQYASTGSACISERRAIEIIAVGAPSTPFLQFGETIRMVGQCSDGAAPFGAIVQEVARA
ncbi:fumarylacetoacetate hydrolase family protein [Novosphingobium aquae]|uniref:Fumarylacetoacetate hydrolase family protein n=1 Tax=Novosphingobium aquae TaxID=3133435 RepID=A0ABU8S4C5_9SPHN